MKTPRAIKILKYIYESSGTWNQQSLCWQGPAEIGQLSQSISQE
jgi:hypothetical protein